VRKPAKAGGARPATSTATSGPVINALSTGAALF
jgi:hypothetical protein